jgi:hypothetical protein
LIGEAEYPGAEGLGAEDAAVHVTDFPPGGVGGPDSCVAGFEPVDDDLDDLDDLDEP